jgi:hypothetical protein
LLGFLSNGHKLPLIIISKYFTEEYLEGAMELDDLEKAVYRKEMLLLKA